MKTKKKKENEKENGEEKNENEEKKEGRSEKRREVTRICKRQGHKLQVRVVECSGHESRITMRLQIIGLKSTTV